MSVELPSRYDLGEMVRVRGYRYPLPVEGIMFRPGKVWYEVAGMLYPSDDISDPLIVVEPEATEP